MPTPEWKLNYKKPVKATANVRFPMQHPVYGQVFIETPLIVGGLTPWTEFHYGWQFRLLRKENRNKTLVLTYERPAGL